MVTAKQRAWRKKFAARYGKKKKKARSRRVRVVKQRRRARPMARRRKKGRSRKSKSIPVLPLAPVAGVALLGYQKYGLSSDALNWAAFAMTGYDAKNRTFNVDVAKPFWVGELVGIVAHKVANKTGVNKYVRKATMGYLSL